MKIQFKEDGILDGKPVFLKGKVYELNANRAYFWMCRGLVESVPAFEGEILDDPLEVRETKVDDVIPKSENKKAHSSSKRGSKSHEQNLKQNVGEDL